MISKLLLELKKEVADEGNSHRDQYYYYFSLYNKTFSLSYFNILYLVLDLLRVLYNLLNDASKPFALHMSALMYHNLGEMMYNIFIEVVITYFFQILSRNYFYQNNNNNIDDINNINNRIKKVIKP